MEPILLIHIVVEVTSAVMLLILLVCHLLSDEPKNHLRQLFTWMISLTFLMLFCDAISWIFSATSLDYSHAATVISTFAYYVFAYSWIIAYSEYIYTYISSKTKVSGMFRPTIYGLTVVMVVLTLISQFNGIIYYIDESNTYCNGNFAWLLYLLVVFGDLIQITFIMKHRKILGRNDTITLLIYIAFSLLAVILQVIIRADVYIIDVSIAFSMLVVFTRIQLMQEKQLKQTEKELIESRIAVMISQIQPHFLYNTLTAIVALSKLAPLARQAIIDFSQYLRGNIDALSENRPVLFDRELAHIETYLKLEKLRFADKLNVIYDIRTKDFYVPVLTIQPLIENAVKHGVGQKIGGGTVTIQTMEAETEFIIVVADDGVGFNVTDQYIDKAKHVGIENTKQRLLLRCGGSLEITSESGVGTTATVKIPKGGQQ